jgi:hypothetical protein
MGLVVGLELLGMCQGQTKKAGRCSLARQAVFFLYAILSVEAVKWKAKPPKPLPW